MTKSEKTAAMKKSFRAEVKAYKKRFAKASAAEKKAAHKILAEMRCDFRKKLAEVE